MRPEEFDFRLDSAWNRARATGVLGLPAARLRAHAAGFLCREWRADPPSRLIDLGTGAGVPGLHLADLMPGTEVVLVDSSAKRCELAVAAVNAVELGTRVEVLHARVDELATAPEWRVSVPAAVARRLGAPPEVAETVLPLLARNALLVVSASDEGAAWWRNTDLAPLGGVFSSEWTSSEGRFVALRGTGLPDARYPRRPAARSRHPWPL